MNRKIYLLSFRNVFFLFFYNNLLLLTLVQAGARKKGIEQRDVDATNDTNTADHTSCASCTSGAPRAAHAAVCATGSAASSASLQAQVQRGFRRDAEHRVVQIERDAEPGDSKAPADLLPYTKFRGRVERKPATRGRKQGASEWERVVESGIGDGENICPSSGGHERAKCETVERKGGH